MCHALERWSIGYGLKGLELESQHRLIFTFICCIIWVDVGNAEMNYTEAVNCPFQNVVVDILSK